MVSKIPPVSPASVRLTNRLSKYFGCFRKASANVEPSSTSDRTFFNSAPIVTFSLSCERISSPCTNGSPASIMVANMRTNSVTFFVVIFGAKILPMKAGMGRSFGLGFRVLMSAPVLVFTIFKAMSNDGASMVFFNVRPAILALYVNSGIHSAPMQRGTHPEREERANYFAGFAPTCTREIIWVNSSKFGERLSASSRLITRR